MKKGIYLVLMTAMISGLANFANKFGLTAVAKDAYQYTTLKNILVALILSFLVLTPWLWPKLKKITKNDWQTLVLIGLVGGSIPFLLFFKGLSLTSAVSASFIHKTLFIWVAILAWPLLKEKIAKLQFLALGVLLAGVFIFDGFKNFHWGQAEMMILAATLFWAVENVIAKIALKNIEPMVIAWGRMFFGSLILIGFLALTGQAGGLLALNINQLGWLALVSILLTGYVVTWYSALNELPITTVASFLVLAAPITAFLDSALVSHRLATNKIWGALVICLGVLLFWQFKANRPEKSERDDPDNNNKLELKKKAPLDQFKSDGALLAARYAFMPNKLRYCGGDDNFNLFSYVAEGQSDQGLKDLLEEFATMYPYLKFIANANQIADPFNYKVVEAYWLGNELLENISMNNFYNHLIDEHRLKDKFKTNLLEKVWGKIPLGAKPHHSFHVFNIPKRTGHYPVEHTLETMEACRITPAQIKSQRLPDKGLLISKIKVEYRPMVPVGNRLILGQPIEKEVWLEFNDKAFIEEPKVGDWVALHWNWVCD
ncbi:MAG: DUF6390 family protein, partial [bacterium]